jgi:serine/threonine protein phosphatase 1
MPKYALTDIHGCLKTFEAMLNKIGFSKGDELFLLGDYVDRGPDSKGVLDLVMKLHTEGYAIHALQGNHEQEMLNSVYSEESRRHWFQWGGIETLESFKVKHPKEIPQEYLYFIKKLPRYCVHEDYIFCHAGLNFDMPNPLEAEDSLIWIRNWYKNINYTWLGDRKIVHGHTPTDKKEIENMLQNLDKNQYLDIDCGCFQADTRPERGYLCCFNLDKKELHFQKCIDKVTY